MFCQQDHEVTYGGIFDELLSAQLFTALMAAEPNQDIRKELSNKICVFGKERVAPSQRFCLDVAEMLLHIGSIDPITFAAVSVLLLSVAFLACSIPGRRAMKVQPMAALRYE